LHHYHSVCLNWWGFYDFHLGRKPFGSGSGWFYSSFGLAVETGIVMIIYLNDAMQQLVELKGNTKETITRDDLREYVIFGAAKTSSKINDRNGYTFRLSTYTLEPWRRK
jgi:hypothetical protein